MSKLLRNLMVAAALLSSAAPAAAAEITFCIWGTITGPDALVNGMSYGTRDYLEFLNQTKGGIAGNKVRLLLLDGRYKLDEELKLYRRCVDQEQAAVVDGWSTGSVKALREQIMQDQVPFLAQTHASEVLDPVKLPYIFIAGPTYEQQMVIALRDLAKRGGKTVVIMHGDNEYGRGPTTVVRQSGIIEKLGLTLLDTIEYPYDAQDMTAQILRVKSRNPDMIYVQGSTPQLIVALRDAAKVGLPADKFVGNIFNISPAIPQQLGAAAEGFRAIQVYSDFGSDIPAMKDINVFKANNKVEKMDVYYMKGWAEGMVVSKGIEAAIAKNGGKVPDDITIFRKSIREELEKLKDVDTGGITPPVSYANHQGSTQARIAQIKDGKYVPLGDWINAQ
jgi:branched-chain amino acid transport system substrate-binding protein